MIRTIVIKTRIEKTVLQIRTNPSATPEQILDAMNACIEDFKTSDPEKYKLALTPDGIFNYDRLYTHVPSGLLAKHGLDFTSCSAIWLEIK